MDNEPPSSSVVERVPEFRQIRAKTPAATDAIYQDITTLRTTFLEGTPVA